MILSSDDHISFGYEITLEDVRDCAYALYVDGWRSGDAYDMVRIYPEMTNRYAAAICKELAVLEAM